MTWHVGLAVFIRCSGARSDDALVCNSKKIVSLRLVKWTVSKSLPHEMSLDAWMLNHSDGFVQSASYLVLFQHGLQDGDWCRESYTNARLKVVLCKAVPSAIAHRDTHAGRCLERST